MLRLKEYNKRKWNKINSYLRSVLMVERPLKVDITKYLMNEICEENEDFVLYKEHQTKAFVMSLKRLIVLTIPKENSLHLQDLERYLYKVYESVTHYYAFCISHEVSSLDESLVEFAYTNGCDLRRIALVDVYNTFVIINKGYIENDNKIKFVDYVGNGVISKDLNEVVGKVVSRINVTNYYPVHYLYV